MYSAIAFLCLAAAMLLALQTAMIIGPAEKAVTGQQHVMLKAGEISSPSTAPSSPVKKPEERKTESAAVKPATKEAVREKAESGEWYYSELHKDWRFRKK